MKRSQVTIGVISASMASMATISRPKFSNATVHIQHLERRSKEAVTGFLSMFLENIGKKDVRDYGVFAINLRTSRLLSFLRGSLWLQYFLIWHACSSEPDLSISKVLAGFAFGLKRYFCPCHYDLDVLAEAAFDQT